MTLCQNLSNGAHEKKKRCMERKTNWHILDSKIPITLALFASDIFIVIAASTNFLPPLIQ